TLTEMVMPRISHRRLSAIELFYFSVSGVAGFLVDASLVLSLNKIFDVGLITAQLIAFSAAVTVTWLINRHLTFATRASNKWLSEWGRYVAANSIGALVNNAVYGILVLVYTIFQRDPVLAVAAGSLAGMFFNFTASKFVVFKNR
ncbi:MAG: GtrA family protein, partial [Thiomonas sp.]